MVYFLRVNPYEQKGGAGLNKEVRLDVNYLLTPWLHPIEIFWNESCLLDCLHLTKMVLVVYTHTWLSYHLIVCSEGHNPMKSIFLLQRQTNCRLPANWCRSSLEKGPGYICHGRGSVAGSPAGELGVGTHGK